MVDDHVLSESPMGINKVYQSLSIISKEKGNLGVHEFYLIELLNTIRCSDLRNYNKILEVSLLVMDGYWTDV